MTHTPGPWEVRELTLDGFTAWRRNTYMIWTPEYDVATDVPGGGPFRKKEDAQLAAAAPDLLAALEVSDTLLKRLEVCNRDFAAEIEGARKANRAALAKAQGE